jgi:hypothetical protein
LGIRHHAFNRHNLEGWCFPRLQGLSTEDTWISFPGATTTTRGRLHLCNTLTFHYAGFRQCSLCGRRHDLSFGEGSRLLGGWLGIFFSHCRVGFQDKSVDFLHSTQSVVNQVRLPIYMYYSGKIFTYKLARTTVTVGAPSMLAMLTSPASAGAYSSASVAARSSAAAVTTGSVLLSATDACGSTSVVDRCDTSSSTAGAGLRLLSAGSPTVSQSPSSPWSTGSEGGISCKHSELYCQHTQHCKSSTRLLYSKSLPLET